MFECVVNVSEGRDLAVLDALSIASGASLRDRHRDAFHHRAVFTLINERAALRADVRRLIEAGLDRIDLRAHHGVHPRFGAVDVVPFVALEHEDPAEACALRDETAHWIATALATPVYRYGPLSDGVTRTLPEVRRALRDGLAPDEGPTASAARGAVAVGCRPILVAWNLWLRGVSLDEARALAHLVRGPAVRALAFDLGDRVQVSCNLIDPTTVGPSVVYDAVEAAVKVGGIERAELVGLIPAALLEREDPARWHQLGIGPEVTIESRTSSVTRG